jgi:hypothetical protein
LVISKIIYIIFGCTSLTGVWCNDFNYKVDKLPKYLTHLTFGYCFNQKVDNLPLKLTHLSFGKNFNQKIDNLPFTIKQLLINKKELIEKIPFASNIIRIIT